MSLPFSPPTSRSLGTPASLVGTFDQEKESSCAVHPLASARGEVQ